MADELDFLNDLGIGDPLAGLGLARPRKKRKQKEIDPEVEESFLSQIGRQGLSAIGAAANVLDIPGSVVRDTIAAATGVPGADYNPFDQLAPWNWASSEGRTTGKQLLQWDDPKSYLDDWAGFGTELVTDPAAYIKPLSLTAKGAAMASKSLAPTLAGRIAKGEQSLARVGFGPLGWAAEKATGAKLPKADIGTGRTAEVIAENAGRAYGKVRGSWGARQAAKLFSPEGSLGGKVTSKAFQAVSPEFFRREGEIIAAERAKLARRAGELKDATVGFDAVDDALATRGLLEGQRPAGALQGLVDEVRADSVAMAQRAKRNTGIDPTISGPLPHVPRYKDQLRPGSRGGSANRRDAFLHSSAATTTAKGKSVPDLLLGSEDIGRLAQDAMVEKLAAAKDAKGLRRYIRKAYPNIPKGFIEKLDSGTRYRDRAKALSKWLIKQTPEDRMRGIFSNHPINDIAFQGINEGQWHNKLDAMYKALPTAIQPNVDGGVKLSQLLKRLNKGKTGKLSRITAGDGDGGFIVRILEEMGDPAAALKAANPKFRQQFMKQMVPADVANDAEHLISPALGTGGRNKGFVRGVLDPIQSILKASWTSPWPGFQTRNLTSGQAHNVLTGQGGSVLDADQLYRSDVVRGAKDIPEIKAEMAKRGLPDTDESATRILREQVFARNLTGVDAGELGSTVGGQASMPTQASDVLKSMGGNATPFASAAGKLLDWRNWNPFTSDIRGGFGGAEKSTFAPFAAGEELGGYVEALNRGAPFIENLKQGMNFDDAAQRVLDTQVDYSPRTFTDFENEVMRRIFPFYSFSRKSTEHVARELAANPGGPLAQTIRATDAMRGDENQVVPSSVADSAAIPWPEWLPFQPDDGSQRYITGLGLMHEDALGLLGPNRVTEIMGRFSPFIKAPLELSTGLSLNETGPNGLRELGDVDPTIGRTLSNVNEWITGEAQDPVRWGEAIGLGQGTEQLAEYALANSPFARIGTTARTLSDPRKWDETLGVPLPTAAGMNIFTGVRATDVSPARQDAELTEHLKNMIAENGGRVMENAYFPQAYKDSLDPERLRQVEALEMMRTVLQRRNKERQEAKERKRLELMQQSR